MKSLYPTGRKHCSKCGCWRLLSDFSRTTQPHVLQARCKACERIDCRIRAGLRRRGKPYGQQKRTTPLPGSEAYKEYRREYNRRWWASLTPKQRERRYEYARIWKHAKARERGATELRRNRDVPVGSNEYLKLPAGPFARWIEQSVNGDMEAWARAHGIDGSQARRIREGEQEMVHIDTVDRALVAAGQHLMELYPDLYPDLEKEAA